MTRRRITRIDAAERRARVRNLRRRETGPTRSRSDAPPAPPEEPDGPAPLTEEELGRLKSGWKFLE